MAATPLRGTKVDAYPEDKFTIQEDNTPRPSNTERENMVEVKGEDVKNGWVVCTKCQFYSICHQKV